MSMVVSELQFYGLIGLSLLLFVIVVILMTRGKDVPSAKALLDASTKKLPVVKFNFSNNHTKIVIPEVENKLQGENYFRAEGILKFWDSSGQNFEILDGKISLYEVTLNMPETVAVKHAALISSLEEELTLMGHSIEGIQDLWWYVISEASCLLSSTQQPSEKEVENIIKEVLKTIQVDDDASRERVKAVIDYMFENRDYLNKRVNRPIQHTWESLVRSWDNLAGYTSRNVEQFGMCVEDLVKLDAQGKDSNLMPYIFGCVAIIGVLVFAFKAMGWA